MMAKIRFRRSTQQAQLAPATTELKANTSSTGAVPVVSIAATNIIHSNSHNDGQHQQLNQSKDDNNKSVVVVESLTKQQQQQQVQQPLIKSDRKKTSRSFRILSLSKHKKQKQQPSTTTTTTTTNEHPTTEAAFTPSSLPTTSVNTTTATNTTTTSSGSRFFVGRSKFKRSSISIANNGTTSVPPSTTTPSTTVSSLRGDISSVPVTSYNGKKNITSTNNSTSNYTSNKTVISSQMPPYEIEITEVDGTPYMECPLCVLVVNYTSTPDLKSCGHRTCMDCMQRYLKTEINHSRLNITCPICSEPLLQNVIREILSDDKFYFKYESFMLRKVLAAEPDARWCPAPDCGYAVLANGCASCPRLLCGRPGCDTAFCYHCKQEWHPNQTCSAANIQRNMRAGLTLNGLNIGDPNEESTQPDGGGSRSGNRKLSKSSQHNTTLRPEDIKECPVCSSRIIKMNDGSCNHMTCSICETEFCWLCMKEISDFHYFSPSGCTFWGKKPWSRKKKLLWRLGMLVGAPICIVFIAGIAVPAIVIGIPVWAARKLHTRLEKRQFSRYRKNAIITGGVLLSFVVSPIISAMALAIGIPILLGYVYGVVPLSLCRSSGGCLSANASVENLNEQFRSPLAHRNLDAQATDVVSISTAASHKMGNPSIGETSLYMSNISLETNSIGHVTTVERDDRESASNAALAGSILSQNVDDGNSTRALAGSIISKESNGFTLIPAEIHNHQQTSNQSSLPSAPTATITTTTTSTAADANTTKDPPDCDQQSSSEADVDRVAMVATAT